MEQVTVISDRFNVRVRPLANGDNIEIKFEVPFNDEAWQALAPLATKKVKAALCLATEQDIDAMEGQDQLPGIDE